MERVGSESFPSCRASLEKLNLVAGHNFWTCKGFGTQSGLLLHRTCNPPAEAIESASANGAPDVMKKFLFFSLGIVSLLALSVATERRALAYVDPGSGLLVLQSIGSAVAAAAYFMRRRIMMFFSKKPAVSEATANVTVGVKSDRKAA
jgi:hypothetical protein